MPVRGLLPALLAVAGVAGCAQASPVASPEPPSAPASSAAPSASAPAVVRSSALATSAAPATVGATSAAPSLAATSLAAQSIPWLDDPVPKVVPPDFDAPITHPVLYRPCTAADVTARPNGWGVAMGILAEFIYLTNASTTPCSLAGSVVEVLGIDGAHQHLFPLGPGGMGQPPDPVANLKPGQTGWMQITQGEQCAANPGGPGYPKVGLKLPGGGVVVMATKRTASPQLGCKLGITPFGTTDLRPPEPTYPIDPIKATIQAPAEVQAGAAFDYTVTLTNPTSKAISLTPCPSYNEFAFRKPDPHPADATYRLNCDGHATLEPGQSLTFAMHTAGIGPTGMGQVSWHLQDGNVYASAWLTVTAA